MTYEMWEAHDRTCRCADCYDGPPSSDMCKYCRRVGDYCVCAPLLGECDGCSTPIFEGEAYFEDADGHFCVACWNEEYAESVAAAKLAEETL